ncbi:MAG: hypothetical protein GXZ06_08835 [Tissierellia bacterium]|nr:hypothetical protein [Tissierellia bacterium]
MTATLTIQDLFKLILFLLGIGALIYLIVLMKNLNNVISSIKNLLTQNEKEIDFTIKQLPYISENINAISKEAKELVEAVSPETVKLVNNASSLSEKLDKTSSKVCDTVEEVSKSISSTATSIKNVSDYIELILDIIEIVRNALIKKK